MIGNRLRWTVTLALALALATLGCSHNAAPPPAPAASTEDSAGGGPRPSRVLPLPGEAPQAAAPAAAAAGLAWDVPGGWTSVPPPSSMRHAQYRVPGPAGDGECIVYYFGPGQGGDAASNAVRWAGQFRQPDGSDPAQALRMTQLEGSRVAVQLVEVTGTYDGGMTMTDAPAESLEGYMLLGAIAEGPDANWFFKLTGPEATVRAERDAFVAMMESLRVGS